MRLDQRFLVPGLGCGGSPRGMFGREGGAQAPAPEGDPFGDDVGMGAILGKRLNRQALLSEIDLERAALDETLALLTPGQMTKPGVTRGGWSVKDVLAHLVEWQRMNLDWYAAGLRGETPAMPAPGYTLRELPRLNAMIYRKHHRRSLEAVLGDYRTHHRRVVALIETVPEADLVTLQRFSWTGPSWTLSDYLRASTAAHYLWARTRIRRWWRAQAKNPKAPAG
jgi:hypothetical protein